MLQATNCVPLARFLRTSSSSRKIQKPENAVEIDRTCKCVRQPVQLPLPVFTPAEEPPCRRQMQRRTCSREKHMSKPIVVEDAVQVRTQHMPVHRDASIADFVSAHFTANVCKRRGFWKVLGLSHVDLVAMHLAWIDIHAEDAA